ncbi:glycerophosphodiester phosphodiesterase [Tuwongella immobilis]|uniref:GP-PDE domain-containing protein n=1 Tax=Tuwongella immobilis TaxID=692036 RepID=A0A6C2YKC1_9BACT|nr:glycerophosphodiester phosphodiesterase [Tuwongella immobilis]VIP01876.1 glycerophosphoryl diester phosphodiesterase : Glycerophosphoryl diester phosphodiesterase OS=Rhodopirellula maiorica SM1 GN=RMSM_07701 PE=4 SV=1: GDPD [Tuwongella immobilis]VTR99716.1 glycerophosphoryl diester phosphodiesterase : Glycerophosphoryl diester phosphodiesterase OS=Rhodopirellula maiorica SM1 GN=RMSM_07701 PE=4 SV=1: GDPD [Tuwongella immobilis]
MRILAFGMIGVLAMLPSVAHAQKIVAHRGASFDAPENTLAAFRLAWEQQSDAIEGDFYLTADGKIVCCHDADTKRTAGTSLKIAESTLDQLRQLDVGRWKHPKFAGERMPTLEEVLRTVPSGKLCVIEIKCGPEIVPALVRTLEEQKFPVEQTMIISFNHQVVAECKKQLPKVPAHWLVSYKADKSGQWTPTLDAVLKRAMSIRADGIDSNANLKVLTPEFVAALRKAKLEFHTWTVDDAATAKALKGLGVDSITTNRPVLIREALRSE